MRRTAAERILAHYEYLLVGAGLCKSNGEARRLIQQGGVALGEEKVTDPNLPLPSGEFILHKGKKVHVKIVRA